MREVVSDIDRWLEQGQAVALATVLQTWGSAPRGIGAKMAVTKDGQIAGSVSGGCVEGAIVEAGAEVLKTKRPQLLHFGVADETAWSVGLACGGKIEVFVQFLDPAVYTAIQQAITEDRPLATVTIIRGPDELVGRELIVDEDGSHRGMLSDSLDQPALAAARVALGEEQSQRLTLPDRATEPIEIFIDVLPSAPTLIMVGGVHIAIALAEIAKTLGYRTIVIDPRRTFGSEARFPHIDRLVQRWPDEALKQISLTRSTAVVMLTHDPKIDDPALKIVLTSHAFYIGALGSRKTHAQRRERLQQAGLSEAQLDRVIGPIGLEIGAKAPEEIALAVMAQIVATRHNVPEPQ
ncbi:MAG TPA: XdhC/CoxI family protein [Anaerolineae bacterium]|nr:XdhC/CoxI family protein [Anaerolineae bacterium]